MELLLRKLADQIPVARPGDEVSQRYDNKFWPAIGREPLAIVYNLDRQEFEMTDVYYAFGNFFKRWLDGQANELTMKEVVRESRVISRKYGFVYGAWYTWEHGFGKVKEPVVSAVANFIYYHLPYGYNIPWAEDHAD